MLTGGLRYGDGCWHQQHHSRGSAHWGETCESSLYSFLIFYKNSSKAPVRTAPLMYKLTRWKEQWCWRRACETEIIHEDLIKNSSVELMSGTEKTKGKRFITSALPKPLFTNTPYAILSLCFPPFFLAWGSSLWFDQNF